MSTAIKVMAVEKGFYGHTIRHPGDEFMIEDISHFSFKWMASEDPRVIECATQKAEHAAAAVAETDATVNGADAGGAR